MPAGLSAALLALLALRASLAASSPQTEPAPYDPYRAEKSVEIGRFYLKRGNYDAAIARFKDAIAYKPNFALPRKLLGDAYAKKKEPAEAIRCYEEYLQILPGAEDGERIRKRIRQLQKELERAARRKRASP